MKQNHWKTNNKMNGTRIKGKYFAALLAAVALMAACNGKKNNAQEQPINPVENTVDLIPDSTVYGVCGEGTSMHSLELVTDMGDTLVYEMDTEAAVTVKGGLLAGDRLAVVGNKLGDNRRIAGEVINLTTLLGKWTSIDKNFEIQEGGTVQSSVKAESTPWTSWKIYNGQLLLNKDTFDIAALGPDSLYLENKAGIFAYKRKN